jgi:hypothetical protein
MTDVITRKNVPTSSRNIPEVNNLRPAHNEKDPPNHPAGKMGEHSPGKIGSAHAL